MDYWELNGHEDNGFALQAAARDAGDLSEWLKLRLARAYQCEQALRAALQEKFRLNAEDRTAISAIAARFSAVDPEQMRASRHNKHRTLRRYLATPPGIWTRWW